MGSRASGRFEGVILSEQCLPEQAGRGKVSVYSQGHMWSSRYYHVTVPGGKTLRATAVATLPMTNADELAGDRVEGFSRRAYV